MQVNFRSISKIEFSLFVNDRFTKAREICRILHQLHFTLKEHFFDFLNYLRIFYCIPATIILLLHPSNTIILWSLSRSRRQFSPINKSSQMSCYGDIHYFRYFFQNLVWNLKMKGYVFPVFLYVFFGRFELGLAARINENGLNVKKSPLFIT